MSQEKEISVSQPAAAPIHPGVFAHIKWLHYCLREAGHCIDGGTCHHECGPKGECWRQDGCVPLTGSRLTDDWKLPAPSPADERAAFEAWARGKGGYTAKELEVFNGQYVDEHANTALDAWIAARAASASETGAEGAKPVGTVKVGIARLDYGTEVTEPTFELDPEFERKLDAAPGVSFNLYAAPQPAQADARVGLTDEQIIALVNQHMTWGKVSYVDADRRRMIAFAHALLQGANHAE